jgi:hypothetical protein
VLANSHEQQGGLRLQTGGVVQHLLTSQFGQEEAIKKPQVIYAIGQSLVSAHPSCRKVAGEILVDFAYLDIGSSDRVGLSIVLRAFEQLQAQHNQQVGVSKKVSKFERFIRLNEEFALSRGRMGSTVGQGPLVKGMDNQQLVEYFVSAARSSPG